MTRMRVLIVAALLAIPLTVAQGGSARACDRHPCHPTCKVNEPQVDPEGGTITMPTRLIDCYY